MKNTKQAAHIAEQAILRAIEFLLKIFNVCKSRKVEIARCKEKLRTLDNNHPDFHSLVQDYRENNKIYLYAVVPLLTVGIDFLLLRSAIEILIDVAYFSMLLTLLVSIALVGLEIILSYASAMREQAGEGGSWLNRNLKYFVFGFLIGSCIYAVAYNVMDYSPEIDGGFWGYISWTILSQAFLLVSSLMLHAWLIRNALDIAESYSFGYYHWRRNKLVKKIEKMEKDDNDKHHPNFKRHAQKLVQRHESFKRSHPDSKVDFTETMPEDLINAINSVMGRIVFTSRPSDKRTFGGAFEPAA